MFHLFGCDVVLSNCVVVIVMVSLQQSLADAHETYQDVALGALSRGYSHFDISH
jgi:hypothetical protein